MGSEKPNFLSQPVVKNIFMFRNGDPYFEARRIVINEKRVSNFETLLREVTGGIQAPFGAVRNIYTPRGGHKVDSMESLQSGEQYVAAGRERFKRLDYVQIGSRKKRMMQTLPIQAKPLPPNRFIVSARFLKPIKEPCTIFVVANGDVLNPAMRLLIHQRMLSQFDKILEMITEKMGLRVLGGVRSLYTYEGHQVTEGVQLESGQLYVAVGRERFKKLPYSDLLFTKPRGTRRVNGIKAHSLPPIYRFSKQNGNAKSTAQCSDSREGDSKASPPANTSNNKEHLSSIVREISQARLISLRKKRSGQSMTLSVTDNDELESKVDDGSPEDKPSQDQSAEEKPADDEIKATEEKEAAADKDTAKEDASAHEDEQDENQETNGEKEGEASEEKKEEEKKEVTDECEEEVKSEAQGSRRSNDDKTQDSKEKEDRSNGSPEGENQEHDTNIKDEGQDKESEARERKSKDQANDVDTGEEEKETENSSDPEKTQTDNNTKENDKGQSSNGTSNQVEDASKAKEGATKESDEEEKRVSGEVSGEYDEVESEAEIDVEENNTASHKDGTEKVEKEQKYHEENKAKDKKEKD
ncbi:uncharacterized protein LOC141801100 [Halichoeres trimaculatus]|uniref:uncharacterized protein LOC141801100 n=1 Tax=Halichoeres trimaculatus TaxID=147232 RepID=UPI003D9E1AB6